MNYSSYLAKTVLMAPGVLLISIGANCIVDNPMSVSGYFLVTVGFFLISFKYIYTYKKYEEKEE